MARVVPDTCNKWRILPFGESFGVDIAYILFMSEHHVYESRNMSVHCVCMYKDSKMFRENAGTVLVHISSMYFVCSLIFGWLVGLRGSIFQL